MQNRGKFGLRYTRPEHGTASEMRGKVPGRLLATSRGKRWKPINAEGILLSLRARLGIERYTLHGIRGTVASALLMLGFSKEAVIALTGHTDVRAWNRIHKVWIDLRSPDLFRKHYPSGTGK